MSEALESLLPCICGSQAELHEWEERDATRWAARGTCNCGWEGPVGYADNRRGCFDAVNNLHKKRAIAAWNKRTTPVAIDPVLRAQQAEIDPLSAEGQSLLYEHSPVEVRTNVGSDGLSDQDRKEMENDLREWAKSPAAVQEALLETIDLKAEAGLCQMTHVGTREFLKDIRALIAESLAQSAATKVLDTPVAEITGADEFGPKISWHTHWVDLIGAKLYNHQPAPQVTHMEKATEPLSDAQIKEAADAIDFGTMVTADDFIYVIARAVLAAATTVKSEDQGMPPPLLDGQRAHAIAFYMSLPHSMDSAEALVTKIAADAYVNGFQAGKHCAPTPSEAADSVEHYIGGRMVRHVVTPPGMTVRCEKVTSETGVSRVIVEGVK